MRFINEGKRHPGRAKPQVCVVQKPCTVNLVTRASSVPSYLKPEEGVLKNYTHTHKKKTIKLPTALLFGIQGVFYYIKYLCQT